MKSQPAQGFPPVDQVGASRQLPRAEFFRALHRGDWAPYHTIDDLGPADYTVGLAVQIYPSTGTDRHYYCYYNIGGPVQDEDGGGLRDIPGTFAGDVAREVSERLQAITEPGREDDGYFLVTITRFRNNIIVSTEKVLYIG